MSTIELLILDNFPKITIYYKVLYKTTSHELFFTELYHCILTTMLNMINFWPTYWSILINFPYCDSRRFSLRYSPHISTLITAKIFCVAIFLDLPWTTFYNDWPIVLTVWEISLIQIQSYWLSKSRSRSRSATFAIARCDGKCQILQMAPIKFCVSSYRFRDIPI